MLGLQISDSEEKDTEDSTRSPKQCGGRCEASPAPLHPPQKGQSLQGPGLCQVLSLGSGGRPLPHSQCPAGHAGPWSWLPS